MIELLCLINKANQASRKRLKTRTSSRRGFGYFYQASYQRNFKVDFDKLDSCKNFNETTAGVQNIAADGASTIHQLNLDYENFIKNKKNIKVFLSLTNKLLYRFGMHMNNNGILLLI